MIKMVVCNNKDNDKGGGAENEIGIANLLLDDEALGALVIVFVDDRINAGSKVHRSTPSVVTPITVFPKNYVCK